MPSGLAFSNFKYPMPKLIVIKIVERGKRREGKEKKEKAIEKTKK